MTVMRRTIALLAGMALFLPATGMQPAAAAKTYKACVKKSNGKVVMLSGKKKCKKGWKRVTWSKSAPAGAQGPQGTTGQTSYLGELVDATGARVGDLVGSFGATGITLFFVRIADGDWIYLSNGWLFWQSATIYYDNASCSGSGFLASSDQLEAQWAATSQQTRLAYRVTSPTLGPATGFKPSGTYESVTALPRWSRDETGTCGPQSNLTGWRVPLVEVPAPPDYVGPLTIR